MIDGVVLFIASIVGVVGVALIVVAASELGDDE